MSTDCVNCVKLNWWPTENHYCNGRPILGIDFKQDVIIEEICRTVNARIGIDLEQEMSGCNDQPMVTQSNFSCYSCLI